MVALLLTAGSLYPLIRATTIRAGKRNTLSLPASPPNSGLGFIGDPTQLRLSVVVC